MVKSGAEPCRERQSSNIYIFVLFLGARLCGFYLRDILLCPKLVCESFRRRDCTIWALANLHHRGGSGSWTRGDFARSTSRWLQIWHRARIDYYLWIVIVFEDCIIWALAQSAPSTWSGSWRRGDFAKMNFDAIPNMALVRRYYFFIFYALYFC